MYLSQEQKDKNVAQQLADEEYARQLQAEINKEHVPSLWNPGAYRDVITKVATMPNDTFSIKLADKYGLTINNVMWEDNARNKNSAWGPCISDMTLQVEGHLLPVIRHPNFEDLTWDVAIERIPLVIGNEMGESLRTISLKEYLMNFKNYLHSPLSWKGNQSSLLAPRDSHVVMSAQSCFLPVPADHEATFNVAIFNYQSRKDNPAVLAIVANSKGTSAQIVENNSELDGQKLYFNKNGQKCSFVGQRLSDNRKERGVSQHGAMTQQEKQENVLLIIQVPLQARQPQNVQLYNHYLSHEQDEEKFMQVESCNMDMLQKKRERADVEHAIIKVGKEEGQFAEINGLEIKRDERYPVRITLQYYKATSNGVIDDAALQMISQQLKEARKYGENIGSMVVGGNTGRPTEPVLQIYPIPRWWDDFWITYQHVFTQYSERTAREKVFKNGRFSNSTLSECKERVLAILGEGANSEVSWNVV